jgi:hypothetical protein
VNHGKAISVILTDSEISAISKKVSLEVKNILRKHREMLIEGALFLDSLEIRLLIQTKMNKEFQMRTFLAKLIQELLESDENKGVKLVVNGMNDSNLIKNLIREGQPLNTTYSLLLDELLIEYSFARELLALLFRRQVKKEYFPSLSKKSKRE